MIPLKKGTVETRIGRTHIASTYLDTTVPCPTSLLKCMGLLTASSLTTPNPENIKGIYKEYLYISPANPTLKSRSIARQILHDEDRTEDRSRRQRRERQPLPPNTFLFIPTLLRPKGRAPGLTLPNIFPLFFYLFLFMFCLLLPLIPLVRLR